MPWFLTLETKPADDQSMFNLCVTSFKVKVFQFLRLREMIRRLIMENKKAQNIIPSWIVAEVDNLKPRYSDNLKPSYSDNLKPRYSD